MPGLREVNTRLGTEVFFKSIGEELTLTQPDGEEKSFRKIAGEIAFETPVPGIYSIAASQGASHFSVNVLAGEKSDLSSCTTGSWGKWSEDIQHRLADASVVWIFGLVALGLLAMHLYLVAKTKGAN